jgi:hypothetical protein
LTDIGREESFRAMLLLAYEKRLEKWVITFSPRAFDIDRSEGNVVILKNLKAYLAECKNSYLNFITYLISEWIVYASGSALRVQSDLRANTTTIY